VSLRTHETAPSRVAVLLRDEVTRVVGMLQASDEVRVAARPAPGTWSVKEILGHLIDSAANNHRRIVLAQLPVIPRLEPYQQDAWVQLQRHGESPWSDLVTLWAAYNRHLAHVMAVIPDAAAARVITGLRDTDVTLGFIVEDYLVHLRHHLERIRFLLESEA